MTIDTKVQISEEIKAKIKECESSPHDGHRICEFLTWNYGEKGFNIKKNKEICLYLGGYFTKHIITENGVYVNKNLCAHFCTKRFYMNGRENERRASTRFD